jgi:aldose 1-epimerase
VEVHVINYGGIITHLKTPDKNGVMEDIVLGYDSLDGYLKESPFFGALIGRYGNRIGKGKFKIDGQEYSLVQNNNGQHLHGGIKGFDKVFWDIQEISSDKGKALRLTYLSKDMEEGYPGNLNVTVDYVLTDNNELDINYSATTDKKTVVNLTQHTYFNLSGNVKGDILDHVLQLEADQFVPVDKTLIPTGKLAPVAGTPFDFTKPTAVGQRINEKNEQLTIAGGYDHCWVLSSKDSLKTAGTLYHPASGRNIEVLTTEPGIQFYSGNFLTGSITGKNGVVYKHRFGLCLETEHFPDSPNQPSFPSVLLEPGQTYQTKTIYRFSVK